MVSEQSAICGAYNQMGVHMMKMQTLKKYNYTLLPVLLKDCWMHTAHTIG